LKSLCEMSKYWKLKTKNWNVWILKIEMSEYWKRAKTQEGLKSPSNSNMLYY
jgi:hypothetical protein